MRVNTGPGPLSVWTCSMEAHTTLTYISAQDYSYEEKRVWCRVQSYSQAYVVICIDRAAGPIATYLAFVHALFAKATSEY